MKLTEFPNSRNSRPSIPGTQASRLITLSVPVELGADGKLPTEVRLFRQGANKTTKGVFLFDDSAAVSVLSKAKEYGNRHCFDYDHAMTSWMQPDPAASGAAAGWFDPDVKDGELWATSVEWTPRAAKMLADKEYRYCSPTFEADESGRVLRLINVALTNLPATIGMDPIVANQLAGEPQEKPAMKTLLVALGLAETASEADCLAAITKLKADMDSMLGLTGKVTLAEAHGILAAWKAGAERAVVLTAEVEKLGAEAKQRSLSDLIAKGQAEGKLAPAMLEWAKKQAPETLSSFLEAAPKLVTGVAPKEPNDGDGVTLTAEERHVALKCGLNPEDVLKTKRERLAARK